MLRELLISAAAAAGAAAIAAPAMAAPSDNSWTGFYAGINGGYAGNRFDYPFSASLTSGGTSLGVTGKARLNSSGFLGGGQIGYDFQNANRVVFGAEADIAVSDVKGQVEASGALTGVATGSASATIGSQLKYLGTVRGRAGYALDRALVYVTAGLAYGKVDTSYAINGAGLLPLALTGSKSATRTGWTAGAGIEYPVTDRLSFKTEYLYVDLGRYTSLNLSGVVLGATGAAKIQVGSTANVVRAGLNYRF